MAFMARLLVPRIWRNRPSGRDGISLETKGDYLVSNFLLADEREEILPEGCLRIRPRNLLLYTVSSTTLLLGYVSAFFLWLF